MIAFAKQRKRPDANERERMRRAGINFCKCSQCGKLWPESWFYEYTDWCIDCATGIMEHKNILKKIRDDLDIDLFDPVRYRNVMQAIEEGRAHPDIASMFGLKTGEHRCPVCGMGHWEPDSASDCCAPALEAYWDKAVREQGIDPTDWDARKEYEVLCRMHSEGYTRRVPARDREALAASEQEGS